MPISLLPTTRRQFLAVTATAGIACVAQLSAEENIQFEEDRFALLADTHIPAKATTESRGANMAANLRSVVQQLLTLEKRTAAAFILGDCAYANGRPEDYKLLGELLAPLGAKDWAIHLALGNHDHRDNCLTAFPGNSDNPLFAQLERRVTVIPAKKANWFLLDSLDKVDNTPGLLGETQLKWLAEALDKHADKPALIGVHHNPQSGTLPAVGKVAGLADSPAFYEVVDKRRHVKAIFFGHTHSWSVVEHAGIHLVNLPPVAYTFAKDKPNGWMDCLLADNHAELTMHCHDPAHAEHGRKHELQWRKA